MINWIIGIALIIFVILYPEVRYTLLHLPIVLYNAIVDLYKFVKYKRYNEFKHYGRMLIYIANDRQPFGSGKTLSLVDYVRFVYNRYNGAIVWSKKRKAFVEQKIKVYSNVKLVGVPYIGLVSHRQIIDSADDEDDTCIKLFVIDELGTQFNNRDWKTNLSTDLLEAILQQRKSKIAILGTVQDWSLFDATLRKVSSICVQCSKKWRFVVNRNYYAKDMERAGYNTDLIKTCGVTCFFATDKVYNSYDTNERVDKLVKDIQNGEMLSNEEVLNCANGGSVELATLTNLKRRYRKRVRK